MVTEKAWRDRAKSLLKAELRRRRISYKELAARLEEIGVHGESPLNIANKLARGRFSAVFMIQCMTAIGCRQIRLALDDAN